MALSIEIQVADETRLRVLAELLATKLRAGDWVLLRGDLGAGKTTFARYLIRAVLGDALAEVPSPTFTLLQTYEASRFCIRHVDLYRLSDADEAAELGLDDDLDEVVTLVEWPDRAPELRSENVFEILLDEAGASLPGGRSVRIEAHGSAAPRLQRLAASERFLAAHIGDVSQLSVAYLQGDASARGYARIVAGARKHLLMDMPKQPDGPPVRDGLSYSRLAHLAEDAAPFVAIAGWLADHGFRRRLSRLLIAKPGWR